MMKHTLTLFALVIASAAHGQRQAGAFRLPAHYRTEAARASIAFQPGPDEILRSQRAAGTAAKTAATAYRLTGWSRYDLANRVFLDSSSFRYSGSRGSTFPDEKENLHAGSWWYLSAPDYHMSSKEGNLENRTEIELKYNGADQVTEQLQRWTGFTGKSVSSYRPDGKLASLLEFDSTSAGWTATRRYTYTYDAAGKRISDHITDLQTGTPLSIVEYGYDAAGRQDTMRSKAWDGARWTTDYLLVNKYNAAGRTQQTTNYYLNEDLELIPGDRLDYSYDAASRLTESVTSANDGGSWELQYRDTFGYTGSKALYTYMKSELRDRGAGSWRGIREWRYSLDAQLRWNIEWFKTPGSNGDLEYQTKTLISYNAAGLISTTKSYTYDRAVQDFRTTNDEEERFWYQSHQPTGVSLQNVAAALSAYPNPATATLNIDSKGSTITQVDLYSMSGAHLIARAGDVRRLDLSQLPAGTYMLHLRLENNTSPQPIRIVKL